jgi:hypothetical protein
MSTDTRPRDIGGIVFALGFIILGVWVIAETREMTALGSVFPRAIAGAMIVFSVLLIVIRLLKPVFDGVEGAATRAPVRWLGFVLVMAAWVVLIPVVGFFTTSVVAFLALIAVANHDRWTGRRVLIFTIAGVVIVVAFQVLFTTALNVPLPTGSLY